MYKIELISKKSMHISMELLVSAIVVVVVVCCATTIAAEPTNGRVWEPMERFKMSDKDLLTIDLLPSITALPTLFDLKELPKPLESTESNLSGEQIRFDHIGIVDMLTNRQPDNPFEINTKFHIYNGQRETVIPFKLVNNCIIASQRECSKIPFNLNELKESSFDPSKRTIIMIGGFLSQAPINWQLKMADKWLRIEDVNVIIVAWNKANKYLYTKAVSNTKVVARQIVMLLYYLAKVHNIDPKSELFLDNIVIVGHSLGAHIAGFVGQDFGGKIGRITGLDPAGPAFSTSHEAHRLDRNDAQFVDAIHTNADFGIQVFLGIYTQVGHVDYYANDGKWQPSCHASIQFLQCNHGAVINYYISILDHELIMRRDYDLKHRDRYRVVAYKAKSFNQFRRGKSLQLNCPEMALDISTETHLRTGNADFNSCGIPIDFIKRPKELRHELSTNYKINFASKFKPIEKYWFFTSPKMPFVVEHNLMKLHYDVPEASNGFDIDKKQCSLSMTYTMLDGEKTTRDVPKFRPVFDGIDHPHTTIPFVNHNLPGRYALVKLDSRDYFNNQFALDNVEQENKQIIDIAYGVFPAKIDLYTEALEDNDDSKKGIFKRWFMNDDFNSPFENPFEQTAGAKMCAYKMKSVRLQPLRATGRLFMAIYSTKASMPIAKGLFKKGVTFTPKIIRLKQGESIPDVDFPGAIINPTLYLDTIVIGQENEDYESDQELGNDIQRLAYDHMRTPYEQAVLTGQMHPLSNQAELPVIFEGPNPEKHLLDMDESKLKDTPLTLEKPFQFDVNTMMGFE